MNLLLSSFSNLTFLVASYSSYQQTQDYVYDYESLPDKDLTLLRQADLETDIDHDPSLLPGDSGHLRSGHEGAEQQLAWHDVGLHHLGVNILLAHHLKHFNTSVTMS